MKLVSSEPHDSLLPVLGRALGTYDRDLWLAVESAMTAECSPEQRACIAFVTLRSLDHELATEVFESIFVGAPIPALFGVMDEAAFWADMAAPAELDAYCLACFNRMKPSRQADFLGFVQGRAAA